MADKEKVQIMKYSKLLTIVLSAVTALFILSVSIAVPIIVRPFYYSQIDNFRLEENTGLTREEIITAYNEMLDFCVGNTKEFSTGVLEWSESGKSHFEDVSKLFLLDFHIVIATGLVIISWFVAKIFINIRPYRFWGRGPAMWASVTLIVTIVIVGGLVFVDFDNAFIVFHKIFFPGKDNWIFDYDTDQIIKILPQDFFMNCAILILVIMVLICVVGVVIDNRVLCKSKRK